MTLGPCGCVDYHYADCPTRERTYDSPSIDDFFDEWDDGWRQWEAEFDEDDIDE